MLPVYVYPPDPQYHIMIAAKELLTGPHLEGHYCYTRCKIDVITYNIAEGDYRAAYYNLGVLL